MPRPTSERVGITGTREEPSAVQAAMIREMIEALPADTWVSTADEWVFTADTWIVTGGCVGIDALVARIAHGCGLRVLTILPSDMSRVDPDWRRYCHAHILMPPGTGYRARDARVVAESTRMLAYPLYAEGDPRSRRSGTWMTVRMARRAGLPMKVRILDEIA